MRTILALFAVSATLPLFAQTTPSKYVSVVGTVSTVDAGGHVFTIKTDKSGDTTVKFDDKTSFLRLPVGETNVTKATPAKSSDVGAGDRILARVHTEDPTGQPALTFYITKQADIAQRNQKTLDEWKTQSVAGSVKSIDPAAKQIVMSVSGGRGPAKDITLDVSAPNVSYERYRVDSAKFEADNTMMASIQVGDHLRVLGAKNADQTQIKAEAIQSDSLKSIPVMIKSIDAASGQITATDIATKKPIMIVVRADTSMKKLDDATAAMLARRLNPSAAGGRGGRGQGGGPPASADGGGGRGRGPGGDGGGRGGGGGGFDLAKILETQATIHLADLKAGEPLVVNGSAENDMSKLIAMSVVAGVDPILRAAPPNGPDPLGGNWNLGGGAGPE